MWQAWAGVGLEWCRLVADAQGARAESLALGVQAGTPWAVRYTLRCDAEWRTRELTITSLAGDGGALALRGDGAGRWLDPGGARLPGLDGCVDVDLSSTVLTNTLPIRRLGLAPGGSAEVLVVYVTVPGLAPSVSRQRYHCLRSGSEGARYRFEAPDSGFTSDIVVDADGLVIEYPGIARRVWPGTAEPSTGA
jgi:hypothetical protein